MTRSGAGAAIFRRLRCTTCLCGVLSLSACAFLPSTGPAASAVSKQANNGHDDVRLVTVTPAVARELAEHLKTQDQQHIHDVIAQMLRIRLPAEVELKPGDVVALTLWTRPLFTRLSDQIGDGPVLEKTALGQYTVDAKGQLVVPYAGAVSVSGKNVQQAERALAAAFSARRTFGDARVSLDITKNRGQHVIVTGASNRSTVIDWRTGGLSADEAIALAGGFRQSKISQAHDMKANSVIIQHDGHGFTIPFSAVLETRIPLSPGDVVVLKHETRVRVECLGGGWTQDTLQSFGHVPSLTEVVSSGGGLNTNTAQGRAVYVLSGDRKIVYRFPWDTLAGLRASQMFPVNDGDVVYIASSPSVRFNQIVNILFSATFPVATVNTVR